MKKNEDDEEEGLMDGQRKDGRRGEQHKEEAGLGTLQSGVSQFFWRICPSSVPAALMQLRGYTNTLSLKHIQLALFSHAACMWITGSPIVLPLLNSSFGATWSDVYVATLQIANQQPMKSFFEKNSLIE